MRVRVSQRSDGFGPRPDIGGNPDREYDDVRGGWRKSDARWDRKRVQVVVDYYDNQTDEQGAAEYEAGMAANEALNGQSMILVPTELVPEIRKLIASRK